MDTAELIASAKHTAGLLKLMSNENRLMILCTLMNQEMSVSELNDHIPLSQSALSQHLAVLRKEEIVTTRRESQTIYYQVANQDVVKAHPDIARFVLPSSKTVFAKALYT